MIQFNMPWEFKFPLKKNKVYFSEGRKRSKTGDGIFGTILLTALPLVGEIVKVFK